MKVTGMVGGHWVKHSTKPHTGHGQAKTRNKRGRKQVDDDNAIPSRAQMTTNRLPGKKVRNEQSIPCKQCKSLQLAQTASYRSSRALVIM